LLAGRSAKKIGPVAEQFGLDWIAVALNDVQALTQAVGQVALVFHAAGPFIQTSQPMIQACLTARTHYIDITGEIPVFQNTFALDQAAISAGVALISGAGFDVVPTDCMAEYVANQVPDALELEVAIAALSSASPGTAKTMLEILSDGCLMRRNGKLVPCMWGTGGKQVCFSHKKLSTVPIPWGDLETGFQTTGIPNITTYLGFPRSMILLMRWLGPVGQRALSIKPLRRILQKGVEMTFQGPDIESRQQKRSYVWARATNGRGQEAQAWLETCEAYQFTAVAGVRCVEQVLKDHPVGALTPALALGDDFILGIEGTQRFDTLPTEQ
jgi:short subunit dehydrogenase-like uncharacterized protein